MEKFNIKKLTKPFNTEIDSIASDKSVSHRCAMFSLFSNQTSYVKNYLAAEDTLNTLGIVEQLGARIKRDGSYVGITPTSTLTEPSDVLDCGNSGAATRLFCGLLAGVEGNFILTGDKHLRNRPMKRVADPLRSIGALIDGRENGNKAPLFIRDVKELKPFIYHSPVDSAQVKSAMTLATLGANGISKYKENELTRDHTERMLSEMGAILEYDDDGFIDIHPLNGHLKPLNITILTDPSSAFFFAVAAAITPKSRVLVKDVALNPTRVEAYQVLRRMGVIINFIEEENVYEPIGDIEVANNELNGADVSESVSWLIDELSALSIAMSLAKGKLKVSNARELRVKENDRISSVMNNLELCRVDFTESGDGCEIVGGSLQKAVIDSHGDHRIAMSFATAGSNCDMDIEDIQCIETSFPNFKETSDSLY